MAAKSLGTIILKSFSVEVVKILYFNILNFQDGVECLKTYIKKNQAFQCGNESRTLLVGFSFFHLADWKVREKNLAII